MVLSTRAWVLVLALLQDGLHALPDPGLQVPLHVLIEPLIRGQACLLTQPIAYQALSANREFTISAHGL